MIHLTEIWRTVIDCRKFVALVFIDFRKAFDSVPHATLYTNNEARTTLNQGNQGINLRLVEELFGRKKTVHSVKWSQVRPSSSVNGDTLRISARTNSVHTIHK